jgi:16S rRNA (guanine527-N7)-methyltransferase
MKELAQNAQRLLGIRLTAAQLKALEQYEAELLAWNKIHNLTAIRDPQQIRVKHFLDSLTCLLAMRDQPVKNLVDVGSGAGFPGIVLKIVLPEIHLSLVESVGKKADFCQHIVSKLGLENVEVIHERVETLGQNPAYRQQYDWAVARAVAVMATLAEYLLPLARVGGAMLAMKGESAPVETHTSEGAIQILGGRLRKLIPVVLPGVAEERYLVVVDKIAATPRAYPRRVGLPTKHPLY